MKLPVTDQFLYDVYDFLGQAGDAAHFVFQRRRTMYDILPGSENPVFRKYKKLKNKRQFSKFICYLKKNNFIKVKNIQGNEAIILTKTGIDKAIKVSFKIEINQRKKRKDGKWIMIIFDIPKNRKKDRSLLRDVLKNLGYKMFQHSVWVNPYDVFQKTNELLQYYSLDEYVRTFLINEI
jgi:hypothetical protein